MCTYNTRVIRVLHVHDRLRTTRTRYKFAIRVCVIHAHKNSTRLHPWTGPGLVRSGPLEKSNFCHIFLFFHMPL